jgi:hypothetical protein
MARGSCIAVIAVLAVALVVLASAVVRLENYRYANFVGSCTEFDITKPQQRIEREKCLRLRKPERIGFGTSFTASACSSRWLRSTG